jgi:uncharacterized protein (DUF433 family)
MCYKNGMPVAELLDAIQGAGLSAEEIAVDFRALARKGKKEIPEFISLADAIEKVCLKE